MIELKDQPVKVAVPMEEPARNQVDLLAAAQAHTNRVVLHLEGIDYDQHPGANYEVYINLPPGQQPDYQSEYYVGSLGFFGMKPHGHGAQATQAQGQPGGKRSFDITNQVRVLQARGEWQGRQPEVTFVRSERRPPANVPLTAAATGPVPPVYPARIDQVSITTE